MRFKLRSLVDVLFSVPLPDPFPTYTIGVYHHVSGSDLGGHPIKIFGWSNEGGED